MTRYIECEAACAEVDKGDLLIGNNAEFAKEIINRTPAADVVLKSEVDYWKKQCFHACMNNGCLDPNIITCLFEDADLEVVAISEPQSVENTETYWISETDELGVVHDIFCAACMYSALNDYRGNPVKSKFCPRCGKFMFNNDQPED